MKLSEYLKSSLVCPYCGDIKNTKWIWQGHIQFYDNGWPFNIGWDYNYWDKNYKKCRCDLGLVMPPHMHDNGITDRDCPTCLKWAVKTI